VAWDVVVPHVEYSIHVLALADWLESHFPLIGQRRRERNAPSRP